MGRTSLVADLEVVGGAMLPAEARLRPHVAIRRLSGAALESGRVEFAELVHQVHLPCLRVSPAHAKAGVRTGSWTGPPRGNRAPRVEISSTVFGVRARPQRQGCTHHQLDRRRPGTHHQSNRRRVNMAHVRQSRPDSSLVSGQILALSFR